MICVRCSQIFELFRPFNGTLLLLLLLLLLVLVLLSVSSGCGGGGGGGGSSSDSDSVSGSRGQEYCGSTNCFLLACLAGLSRDPWRRG